jgi:carboxypeptidase PM20D1
VKKLFSAFAAAILLLLAVIIVRGITFPSRQLQVAPAPPLAVDIRAAAARLSEAIRYRTVSDPKGNPEFLRFHEFLKRSFPLVHARLNLETVNRYSLLYSWIGKNPSLQPILLMAHMDVVPVEDVTNNKWIHDGFSGDISAGFIWGRGSMDDKGSLLAILEAVEHLLAGGFMPERTVYLAFGHDEEIGGVNGAAEIAKLLDSRGARLEAVFDEGGNITRGIVPAVSAPVALIGIGEKGYVSFELAVEGTGGHSSMPPRHTAIGVLSRAIERLENAPFPALMPGATRSFFEFTGPEMGWPMKLIPANMWLFESLLKWQLEKSPISNAMIRTTHAVTMFESGVKDNVLPDRARAVVNVRLITGETITGAAEHIRRAIDDDQVKITPLEVQVAASPVSNPDSASFKLLHRSVREIFPEAVVAPFLLIAATDSRYYQSLTANIFRFFPITIGPEDTKRYHGINERISLSDYERCMRFYTQLIRNYES